MKKVRTYRLMILHMVLGAFLFIPACDTGTEDVDEQVDSGPSQDTEVTDPDIDPEEVARNRQASHDSLVDPECWKAGCHSKDSTHNPDMLPHECAKCHGKNGPKKSLIHQAHGIGGDCKVCHGDVHEPGEDFPSPKSCNVCHAPERPR